ncbi:MAG: hypothetical protein WKF37_04465 [Bryobacteraceae bacterium]
MTRTRDVEGIILSLSKGFEISGRVKIEGEDTLQPGNVHYAGAVYSRPFGFAGGEPSKPDGSFTLQNVMPGRYRPGISSLPGEPSGVKYSERDVLGRVYSSRGWKARGCPWNESTAVSRKFGMKKASPPRRR